MSTPDQSSKRRTQRRRLARGALALALVAPGVIGVVGSSPADAATVCANPNSAGKKITLKLADGRAVADVWYHHVRGTPHGCYVMQARMYRGTAHLMSLTVCDGVYRNCKTDAGRYRYYAGPVYHSPICRKGYVKIHKPNGQNLFTSRISGFPGICD